MAFLDLQGMKAKAPNGGHHGSNLSVTTCNAGKSSLSVLLCFGV